MSIPVLDVENLRVTLNGVSLVDGVSITISSSEVVGIVGESGSGKTMTAMSIAGVAPPAVRIVSDRLAVKGSDLEGQPSKSKRKILGREVGVVFQDPLQSLTPTMRVGTQVAEPARIHRGLSWREARNRATDLMADVQIDEPRAAAVKYPHELSGGMRQRIMIAMALMNEPALLIADEPTTALDVTTQAQVLKVLRNINRTHGTAILLISHDIGVVRELASRVVVMYAGRIIEEVPSDRLPEAKHPYTQALMRSVPRIDMPRDQPLLGILGSPPAPQEMPPGCAYAARCEIAVTRCSTDRPALRDMGLGKRAACHLAEPERGIE